MTDKISMDKQYRTRGGRDVRILCVDGPGKDPVVGFVRNDISPYRWNPEGGYLASNGTPMDLIEVKPKHIRYLNIYPDVDPYTAVHKTRESADRGAGSLRIARIRIEYEEGQMDE